MESRKVYGIIITLIGIILIALSFFVTFFTLIYGIPLFAIGLFIWFNKKEDEIEKLKVKRK